ncbi:MAG: diguanylate cyclase [Planctomycetales bacterium]|nr:diguanylate cyclase [Planctomycetales bacterium]
MPKLSATIRIVLSLVSLSTSLVLLASMLGFFPDRTADVVEGRMRLCESLAINFSSMAQHADVETIRQSFDAVATRDEDIESIGLRRANGKLLFDVGDHAAHWDVRASDKSTESQMIVPVYAEGKRWGAVEVRFRPFTRTGITGILLRPEFSFAAFLAVTTLFAYYIYLRKVLRQLNPSKVIPGRVREAFDSLAEGLVVLNNNQQIVLANQAFVDATGKSEKQLLGAKLSDIPFVGSQDDDEADAPRPWEITLEKTRLVTGRLLRLHDETQEMPRTFTVSSSPIIDEQGQLRGALASFEDVTGLEQKKEELRQMVSRLHTSSEQIKKQNHELQFLATRDPLTGCYNRRSFLKQLETHWNSAHRYGNSLAAIMVDVDHFKSVNDNYGHSVGDEVLQRVATALLEAARESDIVCRFGGEEFVVLLPQTNMDEAEQAAERFRLTIEGLPFPQLSVTASLGVSSLCSRPRDPQDLLDQADKCLYVAKRNGRNQVVRWDSVPADVAMDESPLAIPREVRDQIDTPSIPFHAVTALISALGYRDQETAAHSRRVADLCVSVAEGMLSVKECYVLENAALLHDIGKIGVPDAILLKPGRLTDSEWEMMRNHDRIGMEIIRASFQSPALSEIVENHHHHFGGSETKPAVLKGKAIPVGARILAIADAYDAIVSDRVYRKGRSPQEAFHELRACAGTQFDPELVERFIHVIEARQGSEPRQLGQISTEAALSIGTQLERLVEVLECQDMKEMQILSQRLSATASKYGATEIACKATELELQLEKHQDLFEIMSTATELLGLCRATQLSFLPHPNTHPSPVTVNS